MEGSSLDFYEQIAKRWVGEQNFNQGIRPDLARGGAQESVEAAFQQRGLMMAHVVSLAGVETPHGLQEGVAPYAFLGSEATKEDQQRAAAAAELFRQRQHVRLGQSLLYPLGRYRIGGLAQVATGYRRLANALQPDRFESVNFQDAFESGYETEAKKLEFSAGSLAAGIAVIRSSPKKIPIILLEQSQRPDAPTATYVTEHGAIMTLPHYEGGGYALLPPQGLDGGKLAEAMLMDRSREKAIKAPTDEQITKFAALSFARIGQQALHVL